MLYSLIKKDFLLFSRGKQFAFGAGGFSFLLSIVASLAFYQIGYSDYEVRVVSAGIISLIFIFSSAITLHYCFIPEREMSALTGLSLTSVDAGSIFLAKHFTTTIFLLFMMFISLSVHHILWNINFRNIFIMGLLVLAIASVAFSALGVVLSLISMHSRAKELLLPLLLFPLSVPVFLAVAELLKEIYLDNKISFDNLWFMLLASVAISFTALGWALFEFLIRD